MSIVHLFVLVGAIGAFGAACLSHPADRDRRDRADFLRAADAADGRDQSARQIITSQAQAAQTTAAQFKQSVCSQLTNLFDGGRINVAALRS